MRGVIVHGILLAVMLVYGYRTWTRDKSADPTAGTIVVWNRGADEIQAVLYTTPRKSVRLERRGEGNDLYWWGIESRTDKRLKPKPRPAPGGDAGVAAAPTGGDAGVAAAPTGADAGVPPAAGGDAGAVAKAPTGGDAGVAEVTTGDEEEIITTTTEFPLGDKGAELITSLASMRALRSMSAISDEVKKEYGLELGDTTLAVIFKDGTRTFVIGNKVSGGKERYVLDPETGKGYVLSGAFIDSFESDIGRIKVDDPKGFDPALLASVEIKAGDKTRQAARITTTNERGDQTKTWGDARTKKADQTMANFIDNIDKLKSSRFEPGIKIADLKPVVELTYKDERGRTLSVLTLYKRERAGDLPEDAPVDPTTPPPAVAEYYIVTPRTRVPGLVGKAGAERIEQDTATLLP